MTATPTISAVIPVYNGENYLAEAIRSVLEQSYAPVECIVVDDGSHDNSAEVVRQFGSAVTYVFQENSGVSVARNRGATLAAGDLLAFLDHDDVWLSGKLERQVAALSEGAATLALCAVMITDAEGRAIGERRLRPRGDLPTGMLTFDGTETPSCSSTGLIWKAEFHRLGGFDPRLGTSADWDLLFRVLMHARLAYVDEVLAKYRVHGANMSRSVPKMEHDMIYAYGKVFADPRLPNDLRAGKRRAYSHLYRMLSGSYREAGDWPNAVRTGLASLLRDPRPVARSLLRRSTRLHPG